MDDAGGDALAVRLCIGCAARDNHPRHVIHTGGEVPALWHMDCHVLATDCELCAAQLAACDTSTAQDGVVGDELRARLLPLNPLHQEG